MGDGFRFYRLESAVGHRSRSTEVRGAEGRKNGGAEEATT